MSDAPDSAEDSAIVAAQIGRTPREPWRVSDRCAYGYPRVVSSPALLADGTRFPTMAWLTCPWLVKEVSALESAGESARWARRIADDVHLSDALGRADAALRAMRTDESGGADACASAGIAGQAEPLAVKCLHAHVALALLGIDDPVGAAVTEQLGALCDDRRCDRFADRGVG